MMSISCIIVGSEVSIISTIEKYIQRLIGIRIDATFTDSNAAIEFINTHKPAIVLLDMQMPNISCSNFLSLLKEQPAVLLVGDNLEDFPVGIGSSIIGFLEKPVQFEALVSNFQLATKWIQQHGIGVSPEYLFLKENRKMVRVTLHDILYVECFKDYLVIHCHEKIVRVRLPMTTLESRLDKTCFLRIHKSYLIAIDKIESFSAMSVELKGIELPIGRSYQRAVFSTLSERFCLV